MSSIYLIFNDSFSVFRFGGRRTLLTTFQWRIQKISEGVAVCRGDGDHDQKTGFKAYSRRQNSSLFVSTEKKLKNVLRADGGRRIAYRSIRHCDVQYRIK
jgi:hypothetical protein